MQIVADRNDQPLDASKPTQRESTVKPDGTLKRRLIEGVQIRKLVTHLDPRGSVTELLDSRWDIATDPMVYTYFVSIRPGQVKGWIRHTHQCDRVAIILGSLQWVLYDGRPDSPTHGMVNDLTYGTADRALILVPPGVWHAVRNVAETDSFFVNQPTRVYTHEAPDKELLPLKNEIIPYRFR